ncbi:MAG: hypothetical protein LBS01_06585 [Prevotellaceae bacterium]|jgi:hypothetical protein|nr:hypothetical protein [Prevotellaceae bacterium]
MYIFFEKSIFGLPSIFAEQFQKMYFAVVFRLKAKTRLLPFGFFHDNISVFC